jgi:hypothetical protein
LLQFRRIFLWPQAGRKSSADGNCCKADVASANYFMLRSRWLPWLRGVHKGSTPTTGENDMRKKILSMFALAVAIGGATALPAAARNATDTHSFSNCKYMYQLKDMGIGEWGYANKIMIQVNAQGSSTWGAGSGCKLKLRVLYKQPQTEEWAEKTWIYTDNARNGTIWSHTNSRGSVGVQRVIATVCKGTIYVCGSAKTTTAHP